MPALDQTAEAQNPPPETDGRAMGVSNRTLRMPFYSLPLQELKRGSLPGANHYFIAGPLLFPRKKVNVSGASVAVVERINEMQNFHRRIPRLFFVLWCFRMNLRRIGSILGSMLAEGSPVLLGAATERLAFFAAFLVLARTSSPDTYGEITAIFAFCNLLQILFESGTAVYFQRESVVPRDGLAGELSSSVAFRSLLFIPLVVASTLYVSPRSTMDLAIQLAIPAAVFILSMNLMLNAILYGRGLYRESLRSLLIARLLLFAGAPVLAFAGAPPVAIILLIVLSGIVHGTVLSRTIRPVIPFSFAGIDVRALTRVLRSSLPIGIGLALVAVYDRIDVLLIRKFLDFHAVAVYGVAYGMYRLPQGFHGIILTPAFTRFSVHVAKDKRLPLIRIVQPALVLAGTAILAVVFYQFFSSFAVQLLFGERYAASASIVRLLSFALPGVFLNNLTGVALNALHHERQATAATAIGAVANVTLNLILIPSIGIQGAAVATIVTEYLVLGAELGFLIYNRDEISARAGI